MNSRRGIAYVAPSCFWKAASPLLGGQRSPRPPLPPHLPNLLRSPVRGYLLYPGPPHGPRSCQCDPFRASVFTAMSRFAIRPPAPRMMSRTDRSSSPMPEIGFGLWSRGSRSSGTSACTFAPVSEREAHQDDGIGGGGMCATCGCESEIKRRFPTCNRTSMFTRIEEGTVIRMSMAICMRMAL
jgi:hypothetical protein